MTTSPAIQPTWVCFMCSLGQAEAAMAAFCWLHPTALGYDLVLGTCTLCGGSSSGMCFKDVPLAESMPEGAGLLVALDGGAPGQGGAVGGEVQGGHHGAGHHGAARRGAGDQEGHQGGGVLARRGRPEDDESPEFGPLAAVELPPVPDDDDW